MPLQVHELPDFLRPFFWDTDFAALSPQAHSDFIIRRLLQTGSWQALAWLRGVLGDAGLGLWIEQQHGAELSPRQLRFWELVLDLPHGKVTRWVRKARTTVWQTRNVR